MMGPANDERRTETQLSKGDKFEAGCLSGMGLVACGPVLFGLVFLLLAILVSVPFLIFGAMPPGWVFAVVAVIALIITALVVVSIATGKVLDRKQDDLIKKANLKRAKRELQE